MIPGLRAALPSVAAVLAALAAGGALVAAIGESPAEAFAALVHGVAGSPASVGAVLFQATTLVFTGLAAALPFRAGLFNIGAEGQLLVGSFAATVAALSMPGAPALLLVPACALAAALAGAAWGAIPGILRARLGVSEVINTIMLNFVASGLTGYLTVHVFQEPGQMIPHTRAIPAAAHLPRLGALPLPGNPFPVSSPANASIFVAVLLLVAVAGFLHRTVRGFELRAVGAGERAAKVAGISVGGVTILAMALGGAIAGLAGLNEVRGFRGRFADNFSGGVGFLGIAVALLGRATSRGVAAAALLFGALGAGAVEIDLFTKVPREILLVLQAMILLAVLAANERWARTGAGRRRSFEARRADA